jgi:hypothetical protein
MQQHHPLMYADVRQWMMADVLARLFKAIYSQPGSSYSIFVLGGSYYSAMDFALLSSGPAFPFLFLCGKIFTLHGIDLATVTNNQFIL